MELKWGHLVETLRVLRGWGQRELAVEVGLDKATVAKYEQGVHEPSAESRKKIEETLAITEDVAAYFAELQEELTGARPARVDVGGIVERAGSQSSRLMQAAIWLALGELREDRAGEIGLDGGILIETVRTLRGWSQEELAGRAGVSTSTVSRLERGKARATEKVRKKILNALGLPGIERRVRLELGGMRARMMAESPEVVRPGIEKAGEEIGQAMAERLRRFLAGERDASRQGPAGEEPEPWLG